MQTTQEIIIDVLKPRQNVMHVVQEDSTRHIRLVLLANNVPFDPAAELESRDDLLAFVEFSKPDGHGGMYDTTSLGETAVQLEDSESNPNIYIVSLDGQCFTCPGWTQINVRFETEDGKRIHTFRIMVDVEPTASSDTESTDWGELNSIADLRNAVSAMFEETMSVEAKQALLNLLAHVAYADEHGQDYLDDLETELFRTAGVVSISAVFDQGSAVIYDTDDLETLRQYLTVTATYEDLSEREITAYTLSGTLTVGTSTITVSYGGKTTTFDVTVVTHLLYSLENYAFDTESVGTGVKIFETDQDWSIALDINLTTNPTSGNGAAWRLVGMWVSDLNGWAVNLGKGNGTASVMSYSYMGSDYIDVTGVSAGTGRYRLVITHAKNSGSASLKIRKDTGSAYTFSKSNTFYANNMQVRFGANGTNYALPKGTINKAYIYDTVLTTEQINTFLGL